MLFIDFQTGVLPETENPYFQKALAFIKKWQDGFGTFSITTSGSTGVPKVIEIKRSQMESSAQITGDFFKFNDNIHLFCCLNIDFIAGMMMLVRAMQYRKQITIVEPVSNPFLNILSSKKYDFAAFVPLQLQAILENSETKKYLLIQSGLQNIIIGGAPVNEWLLKEVKNIEIPIFATYGMTETVSHIALRPLNGPNKSDFFEIFANIDFGVDERDCLRIKGKCTNNEWIQTHDIVDLSGSKFKLLGRANRVVNSGGIKIYLDIVESEIEKEIFQFFKKPIRFFLFGENDERLGEKLALAIEAENSKFNMLSKEIFKNSNLSAYKIPKTIYFLKEFAETPTGKIDFLNTIKLLK